MGPRFGLEGGAASWGWSGGGAGVERGWSGGGAHSTSNFLISSTIGAPDSTRRARI